MERNQSLDVLRGIAILLVLGRHFEYLLVWTRVGWSGVDLFFVLSGFLISGLLFSEYQRSGDIDVKRFWLRRGLKIWPPFYAFLGVTAICFVARGQALPRGLLHDAFFLGNYLGPFWVHAWSLAVEEHFYFLLPLLLLALRRLSQKPFAAIPLISICATIGCLYLRSLVFVGHRPDEAIYFAATHQRIDSLLFGVSLGYYYHFKKESFLRIKPWVASVAAAVFLVPVLLLSMWQVVNSTLFTFAFLGYGCLLVAMVNRPPSRGIVSRGLAAIGTYSYGIYLWHAPMVSVFEPHKATLLLFAAYLIACIAAGVLMTKAVERPALALRDRWLPSIATRSSTHQFSVSGLAEVVGSNTASI